MIENAENGGKPSKGTPADKRLKENKPKKKPDENPDKPCSTGKGGPVIRK
jgi:hypothetical protein